MTVPLCTAPMTIYGLDHHASALAYTKKINTILKLLRIWSRFSFQVLIQTNFIISDVYVRIYVPNVPIVMLGIYQTVH